VVVCGGGGCRGGGGCGGGGGGGGGGRAFQAPIFNREEIRVRIITRKLPDGPVGEVFPLRLPRTHVDVWYVCV